MPAPVRGSLYSPAERKDLHPLQSVPDVTAAHTTSEHRRKTDAQFSGQCKQIVTEHPQRLMAVCDQDMPLRRICMLLHRLRTADSLLVKGQYLFGADKTPACRGQDRPAAGMAEQLHLQLFPVPGSAATAPTATRTTPPLLRKKLSAPRSTKLCNAFSFIGLLLPVFIISFLNYNIK